MLKFLKDPTIFAALTNITLLEIVVRIPTVDEVTAILKLVVQILLLVTALLKARELWKRKSSQTKN